MLGARCFLVGPQRTPRAQRKFNYKIQKQKEKGLDRPALNLQIKSTVVGYFFPTLSITLIVSLPSNGVPSVSSPVTIRVTSAGSSISKKISI